MEKLVLRTLLGKRTVVEVAGRLGVRISTARTHVRHLHEKTGTHTLVDLVMWGLEHLDCCIRSDSREAADNEGDSKSA